MNVSSINGVGKSYLGKRDFDSEGIYTTTKWLIIFYLPIIPYESIRVNTEDQIIETMPICWPQALSIYSYFYLLAPTLLMMSEKFHWKEASWFAFSAWAALPTVLRFFAKQRT